MVLMPLLEYRIQTTPLSQLECNTFSAPIRRLLKHNSHFAISTPDCLFKGNNFYCLNDLWNQQMKSLSTTLLYQFNSKSLYKTISKIRLFKLQSNNGLHLSPLITWNLPFNNKSYKNLIGATLSLIKQNGLEISFKVHNSLRNEIFGGAIPLDSLLSQKILLENHHIINKFSLLFLDQFLDNEGSSLITWNDILERPLYSNSSFRKTNVPKIYKIISNIVLDSNNSRLVKNNYRLVNRNNFTLDSCSLEINLADKKLEYISALNTQLNQPIIGKIARKVNTHNNIVI